MVHFKCCYNNRYLVRWSPNHWWLVGAADGPEEDQSKWSCTLFKVTPVDDNPHMVRFWHVNLGHYACLGRLAPPFVVDVELLFILLKYVGFKGQNGKYLSAHTTDGNSYLQFSGNDLSNPATCHKSYFTSDGSIHIKSNHFSKLWNLNSESWIWAYSNDTTIHNLDTLLWAVKVNSDVVSFCNLGNNNYCKRFTQEIEISCLKVIDTSITNFSCLHIKELVVSRKIFNVKFNTHDARIYNQKLVTLATGVKANNNKEKIDIEVTFSYKDSKKSS
ncbi:uncharacterized protein LOC110811943 [Carica papaya]|uniref:uncharacterized protein LOC110811943 n=1 Tax=Carica papaya TaxID=3649 RepID=UPI000B8CD9D6|nr:uncharacterized protein LOC110811943 [Carica papaya]